MICQYWNPAASYFKCCGHLLAIDLSPLSGLSCLIFSASWCHRACSYYLNITDERFGRLDNSFKTTHWWPRVWWFLSSLTGPGIGSWQVKLASHKGALLCSNCPTVSQLPANVLGKVANDSSAGAPAATWETQKMLLDPIISITAAIWGGNQQMKSLSLVFSLSLCMCM